MMGLLGTSFDDPRTMATLALAQGLLGGGGSMQRLASGLAGYQGVMGASKREEEDRKRRLLQEQMVQVQLQSALQAQQQAKAQQERQAAIEGAYRGAFVSPAQQAMAGGGGPTPANAQAMQGLAPKLDQQRLIQGLMQADPMMAAQMLQPKPADMVALSPGQTLFDKAQGRAVFSAPKEANDPTSVQEYRFAQAQGYGGSYEQWVKDKARAGASNTSVSYGAPVQAMDAQGRPVFIQPTKDGSAPFVIPGVRPPKSAAEEKADAERAQRDRQSQQMLSVMQDAKGILGAGRATESGVGAVVDAAARAVGKTTVGAQDAARLQALSGWLVANVPRMEGPQSNYDVQNYMTMAGKIGDSTVPIPERLAALNEVEKLQRKYAAMNGTPAPESPASGVRRYNPQTGRIE